MSSIERSIEIAVRAHRGQLDKARQPYILHPLRVMARLESEEERIVAILHDVIEDSDVTPTELRDAGFSEPIIKAIDALTRRNGESYEEFIERLKPNTLARQVKLADLRDNMNLRRLPRITKRDRERVERYRRAWRNLALLSDEERQKLIAFGKRELRYSDGTGQTLNSTLIECRECAGYLLRPIVIRVAGSKPRDFRGLMIVQCGACDATRPLLACGGWEDMLQEPNTEVLRCNCGSVDFFIATIDHFDDGFFDDGVVLAACHRCRKHRVLLFTD
jgi:hypothetical protein